MAHHVHHQHKAPLEERAAMVVETVVNVVYVTAKPDDAVSSAKSHVEHSTKAAFSSMASYHAPARQQNPSHSLIHFGSTSAALPAPSVAASSATHHSSAAITSSGLLGAAASTSIFAAPLATSAAIVNKSSDNGLSGAAKAGIAIAVIVGLAFVAAAAFLMFRRKQRKNEDHQRLDDEKSDSDRAAPSFSSGPAPRLSLPPVAQLFAPEQMSEKQGAMGLAGGLATTSRPISPISVHENPFGDDAEKSGIAAPMAAAIAPVPAPKNNDTSEQAPRGESSAFPVVVAGSKRNSPPGPGPNNVHRVHMDFKPSMDDELELRAGSLVRMLHEYDDGWALCIRLDRSQQGVVPRTCISKLPVKPRPAPPPGAARGPAPQARANAPRTSPPMGAARPMPPQGARYRSQTNGPRRPESPAFPQEAGRQRANSDAMASRRMTPPSPMSSSPTSSAPSSPPQVHVAARKPVPGQAI